MDKQQSKGLDKTFGFHINRPFYIVSRLPMHRVAEAGGNNNITLKRFAKGRNAQQWFYDNVSKTIKNQNWKNYCMEIPSNGRANDLKITGSITSRWWQMFKYDNGWIVNEKGKVLDVHGGRDEENRNIIVWGRHKGINQQWDIVYADEYPEEPKKGEFNKDFGLYVERPFYIISSLPANRYLDIINNRNFVIKTHFGQRKS